MLATKKKKKKIVFNRYILLVLAMIIVFSLLGTKLYDLQISNGQFYSESANNKAHKEIAQIAPRGIITDKNGTELATNVQSYDITYTETDENDKKFFSTMSEVFKILDENGETQTDDFALKINPFSFQFNTTDQKSVQTLQLRFLKDRGFQDSILKKTFKVAKESELKNDSDKKKLNNLLLKVTPKQAFSKLITDYGIDKGLAQIDKKYTQDEARRYMLVKDTMKMNSYSGYKAVTIASNVKKNTALIFWQKLSALPGINVSIVPLRTYPYGQLGSAVLGYISKISSNDQETYEEKGYDVNSDYVGAAGIEKAFENRLRGNTGAKVVKVDNQGRITSELASRASSPGQNLQLTIDKNVQYAAETSLDKVMAYLRNDVKQVPDTNANVTNATRGAVIAIDVKTGAILALASRPGFDPNIFSNPNGLSSDDIKKYFNPDYLQLAKADGITDQSKIDMMFPVDTSISGNTTKRKDLYDFFPKYLYNYATMSLIPPGSTFKPITAVAGLETGVITKDSPYNDTASFDYGGGNIKHFNGEAANGEISVVRALAVSSNPFFMHVGQLLGQSYGKDILAQYAWKFGMGAKPGSTKTSTGIEIPENFGQVYNSESIKNVDSRTYLIEIEDKLSKGGSDRGYTFPQVDLYDNITDNAQVKSLKQQVKDYIKNAIKNGTFTNSQFSQLLQQLIAADPFYKLKGITGSQINTLTSYIRRVAIDEGHYDVTADFNMYISSIGQGMTAVTPLQLCDYYATLANGGTRHKLYLVDKITDADGKVVSETKPEVLDKVDMKASTLETVKEGMQAVTSQGDGGTAAAALGDFPIPNSGKTGSATFNEQLQDQIGRTSYGFFAGFAPSDDPQIAVVAVIFDGGYGSYAANVVRGVYEAYFKDQLDKMNYTYQYDVVAKLEK